MCGITGIINLNSELINESLLINMRDSLTHRGPDDGGHWTCGNVGLAQRRLSIIDLSKAGHQPFISDNDRYVMVYNGEVYNYVEIRKQLQNKGVVFTTATDTEVVLKAYIEWGVECMDKFNGMFAFAIWDKNKKELFFARDRVGVKPFYYSYNNQSFSFASEIKALLRIGVNSEICTTALDELLVFRYVAGENTMYTDVKKLLPGHYGIINLHDPLIIKRWWNLGEKIQNHSLISKPFEWFEETFSSSINYRMVSDVNVGVLLSGGLDSSSIALTLKKNGYSNIETYNVAFNNYSNDESSLAQRLSDDLGLNFNKKYLEGKELFDKVIASSYFADEPLVHYNDPHILAISELAKGKVDVLLSGEGADEMLGGYLRYRVLQNKRYLPVIRRLFKIINLISPNNNRFKKLETYLNINNSDMLILSNANNIFPQELITNYNLYGLNILPKYRISVLKEAKTIYPKNPLRQLMYLDQHTYLQSLNDRNDKATMGASIECREPFMDHRLLEGIGSLPNQYLFGGKKNKYLLQNSVGKGLPNYITNFRKVGFSVPWDKYIKENELFRNVLENLHTYEIFKLGTYSKINIAKLRAEFLANGMHTSFIIHMVFVAIWSINNRNNSLN